MITHRELIEAGYKRYELYEYTKSECFYQKKIDDEFYINITEWLVPTHHNPEEIRNVYQAKAQYNTMVDETFDIELYDIKSIEKAEKFLLKARSLLVDG